MQTYYAGSGGGCFGAASTLQVVVDGQDVETPISEIKAGDAVRVADGTAYVRCLVRIARCASKPLVAFPGSSLRATQQHPVRIDGSWIRAANTPGALSEANPSGYVYNLLLDRCHIAKIGGVDCATFAHGLTAPVVAHDYFGSAAVLRDLERIKGWSRGFLEVVACSKDAAGEVIALHGAEGMAPQRLSTVADAPHLVATPLAVC